MLGVWPRVVVGLVYMGIVSTVGTTVKENGGAVPNWLYLLIIGGAVLHEVTWQLGPDLQPPTAEP